MVQAHLARLWKRIPGSAYKKAFENSKAYHGTLMVLFVTPLMAHMAGFTASRKVGESVQRNRARRFMKEAFLAVSPRLTPDVAYILVARKPIVTSSVEAVTRELTHLSAPYRS